MTETLCTSGSVKLKAGSDVSSSLTADNYTELINAAEAYIFAATRINFVDTYSSLNADVKEILKDIASSHAAMGAVIYDLGAYPSTSRAQTILDVNYTRVQDGIKLLKEKKTTTAISGA